MLTGLDLYVIGKSGKISNQVVGKYDLFQFREFFVSDADSLLFQV